MEALFQIGKELGELRTRVDALEAKKCGCSKKGVGSGKEQLTGEDRAILAFLKEKHLEITASFGSALEAAGLSKLTSKRLVVRGYRIGPEPVGERRPDICCTIATGTGNYCCDEFNCSFCR